MNLAWEHVTYLKSNHKKYSNCKGDQLYAYILQCGTQSSSAVGQLLAPLPPVPTECEKNGGLCKRQESLHCVWGHSQFWFRKQTLWFSIWREHGRRGRYELWIRVIDYFLESHAIKFTKALLKKNIVKFTTHAWRGIMKHEKRYCHCWVKQCCFVSVLCLWRYPNKLNYLNHSCAHINVLLGNQMNV